jgi:hypothetical protein
MPVFSNLSFEVFTLPSPLCMSPGTCPLLPSNGAHVTTFWAQDSLHILNP